MTIRPTDGDGTLDFPCTPSSGPSGSGLLNVVSSALIKPRYCVIYGVVLCLISYKDILSIDEYLYTCSKCLSFQVGRTKGYIGLAFSFTDIPAGAAKKYLYSLANSLLAHCLE